VNIGSGVSVLAVYGPNNYKRISGTRFVLINDIYILISVYQYEIILFINVFSIVISV